MISDAIVININVWYYVIIILVTDSDQWYMIDMHKSSSECGERENNASVVKFFQLSNTVKCGSKESVDK